MQASPGAARALVLHDRRAARTPSADATSSAQRGSAHTLSAAPARHLSRRSSGSSSRHSKHHRHRGHSHGSDQHALSATSTIGVRVSPKHQPGGAGSGRASPFERSHGDLVQTPMASSSESSAKAGPDVVAAAAALAKPVEDFLESQGVTRHLQRVVTLLLENRPTSPLSFIAEYFHGAAQSVPPLVQAYRYIRMSRQSCDAFMDNLYEAYLAAGGSTGLDADGYTRLLKTLCADLPEHLVPYVFESLQRSRTEVVGFEQFSSGVRACLLYAEFFTDVRHLFTALKPGGGGGAPTFVAGAGTPDEAGRSEGTDASGGGAPVRLVIKQLETLIDESETRTPEFESLRGELLRVAAKAGGSVTFRDFQSAVYRLALPVPRHAGGAGAGSPSRGRGRLADGSAARASPAEAGASSAASSGIWNVPPLGQY